MISFDSTVHLSDIITTVGVPLIGYATVKMYRILRSFVNGVGDIGDVVDEHTDVLTQAGWLKKELPRVGPRKRKHHETIWAVALLLLCAASASAQAVLPTLKELRPQYPTPMSKTQLSDLLNRAAAAHGWKMLRKDAGNNCPTPYPGVSISCDWLFDPATNWGFDVIRDQEGVASVEVTGDGGLQAGQELVIPWGIGVSQGGVLPSPPPSPQPVPTIDLSQVIARLDALYAQRDRTFENGTAQMREHVDAVRDEVKGLRDDLKTTVGDVLTFIGKYVLPPIGAAIATWQVSK